MDFIEKIDPTRAHRLIAIGNQEMQLILDDIKHVCTPKSVKALPLSDHKRRKQRELYYIVIDYFLTGYLRHQTKKSNSDYDSKKLEFIPASHKHMEGMVGDAWDRIRVNLIEVGILVPNNHKNIPEDSIKKTAKSYSAGNTNTEPYSRAFRLDSEWLDESLYSVTELKYVAEKHYPLKAAEISTEPTQSTKITIDVEAAISTLNDMAADPKDKTTMPTALMFTRRLLGFNSDYRKPTICSTGREFNKVNGLPAKIRKLVKINDNPVVELDIKSCLPSILYKYTETDNEKTKMSALISEGCLYRVASVCSGMLDQKFLSIPTPAPKYKKEYDDGIKRAKLAFCCYLGGSTQLDPKAISNFIAAHFPTLHSKLQNMSRGKKRGEISRILQASESRIVVQGMGRCNFEALSIHDGVMVETHNATVAHAKLVNLFEREVGIKPIVTGLEEVEDIERAHKAQQRRKQKESEDSADQSIIELNEFLEANGLDNEDQDEACGW